MNPTAIPNPAVQTPPAGAPMNTPSHADIRDLALKVFGTPQGADFWMERPNPELGGAKPNELISAGRAQVVKEFLESLLEGDFG
jgi:uncharacterized protein (DUF2384 family)